MGLFRMVFLISADDVFISGLCLSVFLVPWAPGPPGFMFPQSSGPLVPWSPGPLVLWPSGPLVPWSSCLFRGGFISANG